MFEELIHIDQQWLLAINGCHAPWADTLMWIISGKLTWLPLYILLIALIFIRCKSIFPTILPSPSFHHSAAGGSIHHFNDFKLSSFNFKWWLLGLIVLTAVAGSAGLADFISSGIIKHTVCRLRPTHEPALAGMIHLVNGYTGGQYGFVSSHAANTMACALSFSLFWAYTTENKKRAHLTVTLPLMVWVALNCYSRMYLGVHYPGDIMGGLVVGTVVAVAVYQVWVRVLPKSYQNALLETYDHEDPRSLACS